MIGNASMASRATRYARSSRNPWRTSWTIGRQVTTSSRSITDGRLRRLGRRKTSTQTEVSTSSTGALATSGGRRAIAHLVDGALPEAGAGQFQYPVGAYAPHEFRQRTGDGRGVRSLPAQLDGLLQQVF